ncbi:hypothetical protein MRX96_011675 [Rhipicephalus microplus]
MSRRILTSVTVSAEPPSRLRFSSQLLTMVRRHSTLRRPSRSGNRQQEQERHKRRVIIGSALWLSFVGLVLVAYIVWALTSYWDISPEAARGYSNLMPYPSPNGESE